MSLCFVSRYCENDKNVKDALQVPEWKKAILEEMRAFEKIGTWEAVELPIGKKILDVKNSFLDGKLEEEVYVDPPSGFEEKFGTRVCDDVDEIRHLNEYLALEFEINDLGPLKYFLGMEVARSKKGLVARHSFCSELSESIYALSSGGNEETVFRILRYLKSSPGKGLFFKKSKQKRIEAYTDADWAGSITDRRSTSRYCTFV
ncbi:uncharacterized protein LOC128034788 [Gossypium raimondii]|uniref:uncharacterized protein LOC128034788 n=1 Tax=Gossypium raimondii TaxID=29730 RepID=UPI00227D4FAA|nr:uncharacterized protein LOC128034788 [Gossypium raimondii]